MPTLQYRCDTGALYCGDSRQWLLDMPDASVDLIFADPPYNVKKAEWDDFESQERYIAWSIEWMRPFGSTSTSTRRPFSRSCPAISITRRPSSISNSYVLKRASGTA